MRSSRHLDVLVGEVPRSHIAEVGQHSQVIERLFEFLYRANYARKVGERRNKRRSQELMRWARL
jgi:hypothetical protein